MIQSVSITSKKKNKINEINDLLFVNKNEIRSVTDAYKLSTNRLDKIFFRRSFKTLHDLQKKPINSQHFE